MNGQTGPKDWIGSSVSLGMGETLRSLLRVGLITLLLAALNIQASADESVNIVARVILGGGQARRYRGQVRIDQGQLRIIRPLGTLPHSIASVFSVNSNSLAFDSLTETGFEGFDIEIVGDRTSQVAIELKQDSSREPYKVQTITLETLIEKKHVHQVDSTGNRLLIERAPGDRLRVDPARTQLVFSPGEIWNPTVEGVHTGFSETSLRLQIQVTGTAASKNLIHDTRNIEIDSAGNFGPLQVGPMQIPLVEGVYQLRLRLEPRRLLGNLVTGLTHTERSVQFVVIDPSPRRHDASAWRAIRSIQPSGDSKPQKPWADFNRFTDFKKRAWEEDFSASNREGAQTPLSIAPQNWTTCDIGEIDVGRPYQIAVHCMAGHPMRLAMSILDPDSVGNVRPLNLDTGILVPAQQAASGDAIDHQFVFWPKTTHPQLLLYNPDGRLSAHVKSIELLAGPQQLEGPQSRLSNIETQFSQRLVAVHLDRPFLNKLFGAADARDEFTRQSFDDWQTFYQMANRLAEYCHWAGYNGAIVTVASEGGTLFPSKIIQSTPRYDNGAFFSDARDPMPKDVIELLLRVFDREGLQLVTSFDLNSPIPILDDQIRHGIPGLLQEAADLPNRKFDSRPEVKGERYQPINSQVQTCFASLFDEMTERYREHPSWKGIALRLGPQSHFCFAGDAWGYDDVSIAEFSETLEKMTSQNLSSRTIASDRNLRNQWLQWRSAKLADHYEALAQRLGGSNRKLFLLTSGFFQSAPSSADFVDPVAAFADPLIILNGHGADLQRITNHSMIVALRGESWQPLHSFSEGRWSWQSAFNTRLDEAFAYPPVSGAQLNQQPQPIRLDVSDRSGPFAEGKWDPLIFPQLSFTGNAARSRLTRRFAADDCLVLAEGGWQANVGQENQCRDLLAAWTKLPPTKLKTLKSSSDGGELSNAVVRSGDYQGHSYFVLINQAPWQETFRLQWQGTSKQGVEWLSPMPANQTEASLDILPVPPYSIRAFRMPIGSLRLADWVHFPEPQTPANLDRKLQQLTLQLNTAAQPSVAETELLNGDFELRQKNQILPVGWTSSMLPSGSVTLDPDVHYLGDHSLRIENRGQVPIWIQSDVVPSPLSGRLAVAAYVRIDATRPLQNIQFSVVGKNQNDERFERHVAFQPVLQTDTNGWYPVFLPLILDVPPDQVRQLRLSIDVTGTGVVWVDNVRLYDTFITEDERRSLRAEMFLAKTELDQGRLLACQRLLESYWADYLAQFASPDDSNGAGGDAYITERNNVQNPDTDSAFSQRGWLQRIREGVRRKR